MRLWYRILIGCIFFAAFSFRQMSHRLEWEKHPLYVYPKVKYWNDNDVTDDSDVMADGFRRKSNNDWTPKTSYRQIYGSTTKKAGSDFYPYYVVSSEEQLNEISNQPVIISPVYRGEKTRRRKKKKKPSVFQSVKISGSFWCTFVYYLL